MAWTSVGNRVHACFAHPCRRCNCLDSDQPGLCACPAHDDFRRVGDDLYLHATDSSPSPKKIVCICSFSPTCRWRAADYHLQCSPTDTTVTICSSFDQSVPSST